MSACPEMEALLTERASGALEAEDAARLDAHLDGCEGCRAELHAYQELFQMARLPPPETRVAHLDVSTFAAYQRSRRRRVTGLTIGAGLVAAAVAASLVIVPAMLTLRSLPRPSSHVAVAEAPYAATDLGEGFDAGYVGSDVTSADVAGTYQQQGQVGPALALSSASSDEVLPEDAALAAFDEIESP